MSTFIDLDSIHRDIELYPNPCDYQLEPKQVRDWFSKDRTTRAYGQNPGNQTLGFVSSITTKFLTLPYTEQLSIEPRVYVNFSSTDYKDKNLIQSINGVHPDAKFVCQFLFIQKDAADTPVWIHYKAEPMTQSMRFNQGNTVRLQITLRDGSVPIFPDPTIPLDNFLQSLATFEIMPYIKSQSVDNHLVETL